MTEERDLPANRASAARGCADEAKIARLRSALDLQEIETIAENLRALSDPTRVRIVWALTREPEVCVSELIELLHPLKQSSVSHALKALRSAELVHRRREGKVGFYSLKSSAVRDFLNEAISNAKRR